MLEHDNVIDSCVFVIDIVGLSIHDLAASEVKSQVRDGIYKTLTLGHGWKSLLRSCEREKERGETARAKASRAIVRELYAELSGGFIRSLSAHAMRGEALFEGFGKLGTEISARDLGGCNSPFENNVLRSYSRLQDQGVNGRERVTASLREGIDELKQRRSRQIEQHCLQEAGSKAKPILNAVRTAISKVENIAIVDGLLEGKDRRVPRIKNAPIDLDENLTDIR
jgi:hypothetical protein